MKRIHLLLVASLLFAVAFTLSCSEDKGGGWLTCQELIKLEDKCANTYEQKYDDCKDRTCRDKVESEWEKCFIGDACNGASMNKCEKHYKDEGCFEDDDYDDDDDDDYGGGNRWLTCNELDNYIGYCEAMSGGNENKYNQCILSGACNGTYNFEMCEAYYRYAGCLEDDDDDDDNNGGGSDNGNWLSCREFNILEDNCDRIYDEETNACGIRDYACWDAADENFDECIIDGACNGASESLCWNHYERVCGF